MKVSLALVAAVSTLGLTLPAAGSQNSSLPVTIANHLAIATFVPKADYHAVDQWPAVGGPLQHETGEAVADSDAMGGRAWQVGEGSRPNTAMVYGPYASIPMGDYVAFFRLKRVGPTDSFVVGNVDVATDNGQTVINRQQLLASQLPQNRYVDVPVAFHAPGTEIETRVNWGGDCELRADHVSLYRITNLKGNLMAAQLPTPTESGKPSNVVPVSVHNSYTDIFPRSKTPAQNLDVIDMRGYSSDWQLAMDCLEGLVNREQPRIYLIENPTDVQWLQWMKQKGWIKGWTAYTQPQQLLNKYKSSFKGAIVFDPLVPASVNVATALAGVDDGLAMGPLLADKLHLAVLRDLRGKWQTAADAYEWEFTNLWPHLSHRVIACSNADQLFLRDYLVENRVFTFWISGTQDGTEPTYNPTRELHLMERLLAKMPANIPVMSYPYDGVGVGIGEGPGVTLFAQFGKYLVGSTNCSNLSVHSGIELPPFHQPTVAPPPLKKRVYVTWIMSDGDNLPVLTVGNFPQFWQNPLRGSVPIGWSISPSAALLIPDIADYYYSHATADDEFVGAVSGIGYTYPDSYGVRFDKAAKTKVFSDFLHQTALGYKYMDLNEAWLMNITSPELFASYARDIPGLKAIFPDYGQRLTSYNDLTTVTERNVPVFHAVGSWSPDWTPQQAIDNLTAQIKRVVHGVRPAFLQLFGYNWFTRLSILKGVLHKLGPDYVGVRPDQLTALYRRYLAEEKVAVIRPGHIAALPGRTTALHYTLQDTTDAPIAVRVAVTGLHVTHSTLQDVNLQPGIPVAGAAYGMASGAAIKLDITGQDVHREVVLPVSIVDPHSILGGPAALPSGNLQFTHRYIAVDMGHRTGSAIADPLASSGEAWATAPLPTGSSPDSAYVLYGPYAGLQPGSYVAMFRIERTGKGTGALALLDVSTNAGATELAKRTLQCTELPIGRYAYVPLRFVTDGSAIETRVMWLGGAPLHIDCVDVWRVPANK